jgi:hypothetical protein
MDMQVRDPGGPLSLGAGEKQENPHVIERRAKKSSWRRIRKRTIGAISEIRFSPGCTMTRLLPYSGHELQ